MAQSLDYVSYSFIFAFKVLKLLVYVFVVLLLHKIHMAFIIFFIDLELLVCVLAASREPNNKLIWLSALCINKPTIERVVVFEF